MTRGIWVTTPRIRKSECRYGIGTRVNRQLRVWRVSVDVRKMFERTL